MNINGAVVKIDEKSIGVAAHFFAIKIVNKH